MDPVEKAVLCCLSEKGHHTDDDQLPQLSTSDWDRLLELAACNGITPLVYKALKDLSPATGVPSDVLLKLREIYYESAGLNVLLYRQLTEILVTLLEAGIPVIVLKGACLAEMVYRNIALRPMMDIDLLVRRKDLIIANEKIMGLGYTPSVINTLWEKQHFHFVFWPPNSGVTVELHWDIFRQKHSVKNMDIGEIWERSRQAVIGGVPASVLSPEDLLLYVCLHNYYHYRVSTGIKGLCDILEIIRFYGNELDWEELQRRIRRWGVTGPVYFMLYLAVDLLGAAVRDDFLDTLRPHDFDPQMLLSTKEKVFSYPDDLIPEHFKLLYLLGPNPFREKAHVLLEAFINLKDCYLSKEYLAYIYSVPKESSRIYMYYPVFLKDLLFQCGSLTWKYLCGDKQMTDLVKRGNAICKRTV